MGCINLELNANHKMIQLWFKRVSIVAVSSFLLLLLWIISNALYPEREKLSIIVILAFISIISLLISTSIGIIHLWNKRADLRRPILFSILIFLIVLSLHLYTINSPSTNDCYSKEKDSYGCIMDEVYYVPAAQALLAGRHCEPYADSCNMEHPFLAKLFISAGIAAFGLNVFGWRIAQAILGSLSIPLLFVLCLMVSRNRRLSYFTSILFATETLFFVHSSAALIDIHPVFFSLLSLISYFYRKPIWKIDGMLLSGVFMGLAGLSKETAIFYLLALITYHNLFYRGSAREHISSLFKIIIFSALTFIAGMQLYNSLYTSPQVPTFIQHLQFIISYGSGLTCPPFAIGIVSNCGAWVDTITNQYITPLNWITFYSPVSYYVTHVTESIGSGLNASNLVYVNVGYYGVTNMLIVWMVFLWVPISIRLLLRSRRLGINIEASYEENSLIYLALVIFLWNYLPYLFLWAYGRVTYPFYIIQAIPALVIGCAYFISREWFPRRVALFYIIASCVWFFYYYPDKAFLPAYIRAILGR